MKLFHKYKKLIRPFDVILTITILLASFIPVAVFALQQARMPESAFGSTVYVLIELEVGMNRCGVDTKEKALTLAKQIHGLKGLVFEGFQAYTGQLCHIADKDERIKGTVEAEAFVLEAKLHLEENGIA